jgi:adenylate cyclase
MRDEGAKVDPDSDLTLENERLQAELRDALDQQRATADVMRILTRSAFDQHSVFEAIVSRALDLCEADNATLALFENGRARAVANAGDFKDEGQYLAAFGDLALEPDPSTIVGRVLLAKETVHIPSMRTAHLRRAPGPATGARAVLAVPLLREHEVVGMLVVRRRTDRPFNERHTHLLETFAAQAVIAIENTRLFRTIKRQTEELCRFVSPQVADLVTSDEGIKLLDGHRRLITAVFCELRGFPDFSQTAAPEEVLGVLREYHSSIGELAVSHGGTLDHFAGEGLMVFFNDPVPMEHHERAAVRFAVALRQRFVELSGYWKRKGYGLGLGIGVATGHATLGRIGFERRYDYGAVGNVVIVASRLASEAADGHIVISDRVHEAIEGDVESTPLGQLSLSGLHRPVGAFEVAGVR